jgi:hypothetical protein
MPASFIDSPRTRRRYSPSAPPATVGVSYTLGLIANGGGAPTWAITAGALPPGLTLNATTGVISGTPTTTGSYTFEVEVADALYPDNVARATEALVVKSLSLVILTQSIPDAKRTYYYETTLQASGGTGAITWRLAAGSLPYGMTLSSTGTISGKSGYTGCWTFTAEARDSGTPVLTAQRQYTLVVRTALGWKPPCAQ